MNQNLVNNVLRVVALAMMGVGHSGVLPQPWAQIVGELGSGILLLTQTKPGDIRPEELPKEILESIRPSNGPK